MHRIVRVVVLMVMLLPGVAGAQEAPQGTQPAHRRPWDPPAPRTSFTWEIGFGVATTSLGNSEEDGTHVGLAPGAISLGGFLNERLALMARLAATAYNDKPGYFLSSFWGAVAQYWPTDRLFLSGGLGVAMFNRPIPNQSGLSAGLGVDARVGLVLAALPRLNVSLMVETIPAFYSDRIVVGSALALELQHL